VEYTSSVFSGVSVIFYVKPVDRNAHMAYMHPTTSYYKGNVILFISINRSLDNMNKKSNLLFYYIFLYE
jgi:hypothetical protein